MALDDIKNYLVGLVLLLVIMLSGGYIFGTFYTHSSGLDASMYVSFNRTMDRSANLTNTVNQMQSSVTENEAAGVLGYLNAIVGVTYHALQALVQSIGFVGLMFGDVAGQFGVPPFITALLLLIVTIIVVIAIWSAITKT